MNLDFGSLNTSRIQPNCKKRIRNCQSIKTVTFLYVWRYLLCISRQEERVVTYYLLLLFCKKFVVRNTDLIQDYYLLGLFWHTDTIIIVTPFDHYSQNIKKYLWNILFFPKKRGEKIREIDIHNLEKITLQNSSIYLQNYPTYTQSSYIASIWDDEMYPPHR